MDTLVLLALRMIVASSGCMHMSRLEKPTVVSLTPPSGMSLRRSHVIVSKKAILHRYMIRTFWSITNYTNEEQKNLATGKPMYYSCPWYFP
jgi:hypothetical protein